MKDDILCIDFNNPTKNEILGMGLFLRGFKAIDGKIYPPNQIEYRCVKCQRYLFDDTLENNEKWKDMSFFKDEIKKCLHCKTKNPITRFIKEKKQK